MPKSEEDIWIDLALLFFESKKPKSVDVFYAVADTLKSSGWSKTKAEEVLVGIVTPHAKRWLGYGLPLAIGEEINFWDKSDLILKMRNTEKLRAKYPPGRFPYYFALPDWLNRRLLKRLGVDRLLILLQ